MPKSATRMPNDPVREAWAAAARVLAVSAASGVRVPTAPACRLVGHSYDRHPRVGKGAPREQLRSPTGSACRWACRIRDDGSCPRRCRRPLPARRRYSHGRCEGERRAPTVVLLVVLGVVRSTASGKTTANAWPSSLRLHTVVGGLDRIAYRRAQADTGEDHVRRARWIGDHVAKAAGRLVDAGLNSMLAQEADDHIGIEIVGLHQTVHVLVLFVGYVRHRGVKLGERRHHAATSPR